MKSVTLVRVERPETVKDTVYRNLRSAILQGTLDSNTVLAEAAVAEKLGVSRTPVREALQQLEREGLLQSAGARGKRVRRITTEEIKELFWLRRAIEGATVEKLAAQGLTPAQKQTLTDYLARQSAALDADDRASFLANDSSFHAALASFTGFNKVGEIITNLRQLFQLIGLRAISEPHRLEQVLTEHQAIVNAISKRRPDQARKAMEQHLSHTETISLAKIAAENEEASREASALDSTGISGLAPA
jgi:DNA-binding GntR family transcriptional regulator